VCTCPERGQSSCCRRSPELRRRPAWRATAAPCGATTRYRAQDPARNGEATRPVPMASSSAGRLGQDVNDRIEGRGIELRRVDRVVDLGDVPTPGDRTHKVSMALGALAAQLVPGVLTTTTDGRQAWLSPGSRECAALTAAWPAGVGAGRSVRLWTHQTATVLSADAGKEVRSRLEVRARRSEGWPAGGCEVRGRRGAARAGARWVRA
jgi:hypothetical protein